jgi:L-alanine-DL-glutamate epimerase-like enolase superfamily enzyme
MSPQERRRRQRARQREDDDWRRTGRHRRRSRAKHRKKLALLGALAVVVLSLVAAGGITGAATVASRCDLDGLRPVSIGQNSFVYAADGSLLGSIPAEKNRQPVSL